MKSLLRKIPKPTANWLDHVITSRARSRIKVALNEEKKRIAEDGKELLRRKLKQLKDHPERQNHSKVSIVL